MARARRARAPGVERPRVAGKTRVLDAQEAARREDMSVARVARWKDAIEHVDTARDRLDEIFGRADAHEVARPVGRHAWRDERGYAVHLVLRLADREPSDRVSIEANAGEPVDAFEPQVVV